MRSVRLYKEETSWGAACFKPRMRQVDSGTQSMRIKKSAIEQCGVTDWYGT